MMVLFCATVGVFLAGTYVIIYSIFDRNVQSQLDRRLLDTANPMVADLVANPSEQDVFTLNLPDQYLELVEASGHVLQYSLSLRQRALGLRTSDFVASHNTFQTLQDDHLGRLRFVIIPFLLGRSQLFLAVGVSTREVDQTLASFRRLLLTLLPLSLLATALISAWYTGRSLRPIADLTRHAAQLTEKLSDWTQRDLPPPLPISNPHDELGRLAITFNKLFIRLSAALTQLLQFVSNASHEIRTPLAVLRGETELLLAQRHTPEEYESNLRVIDNELKMLGRIVEGLFTLSIADAGQLRLGSDRLYLDDVLEEACQLALVLAKTKSIAIERNLKHEVRYEGDEVFLRQLFLIFLDNAIKYSPPHTRVRVDLERMNGSIKVHFADEGPGIATEHVQHIFERFYRAAGAESGETRSGGLGLAIARALARAHGGSIECTTAPGAGSRFTVLLPQREWPKLNGN
jgi:signal transduction histidine kinase